MLDRLLTAAPGPARSFGRLACWPRCGTASSMAASGCGRCWSWKAPRCSTPTADDALRVAAALECVHCYSLIHDDLPSMDDDDLRRGQPTVHRAFDEATAILAGDSLLTLAFDILASSRGACRSRQPRARRRPCACRRHRRHGRRPGARPCRRKHAARRDRHHHAAGHEDRRADPLRLRGRSDRRRCQPRPTASGSANSARRSGLPSSLPTTCSTCRPTPAPWARRPARTRPPARRRLPRSTARTGRAGSCPGLVAQAQALLEPFGERARLLDAAASFVADRRR